MAATIDMSTVKALLSEMGYSIPDAVLTLLSARLDGIDDCMDGAGYDDTTQQLIKLYALALMSASSGARQETAHSAPSGASQSFRYGTDGMKYLAQVLAGLDPNGCTAGLPIQVTPAVGFFMVAGGCDER